MRELNIEEIKKIQLKILDEVAHFCDKYHISYFLCAGTLLGAIRHRGFIPWDDDIDIMVPRPDYDKLIRIFHSEKLKLYEHNSILEYNKPFAKIADVATILIENTTDKCKIGINIDVFPIDGFPSNAFSIDRHLKGIRWFRNILSLKQLTFRRGRVLYKNIVLGIAKPVTSIIPAKYLLKQIVKRAKKYDFGDSSNVGIAVWGYGRNEVCPASVFKEWTYVEFENRLYKCCKDYHTYLTNLYGDFMKLPPVENRITHHDFRAFIET